MSDVLIKWPTRSRPDLFKRTFAHWQNPRVRFLVTIDEDDPACNNPGFRDFLESQPDLRYAVGHSKSKVEAINADMAGEKFDLLILASDDFVPEKPDYDLRILELMAKYFPDGDGALHLPEGRRTDLCTLPILDWKYYGRFGYIYHPAYTSVWCDNEYTDVGQALGRLRFHDELIVRHNWIGTAAPDELHQRNETYFRADKEIYERRKAEGFPR